ncbi:phosphate ABC transporter substrate-binding protein PstS family protein [Natrinema sp. 1APR25-10V2]|uniref:phosphate ABC transporter substrate-binding protein PstS family protein n=1 Tax=Natrinema sp. 1APR25-10V2 TaxID=2951081 RepID=UPI00287685EF|nr:phosphate ABC transporter substrate-binding protein PstS family protein [Natrinema sp. 1APR25-10V2]MDS0478537.1 phosphate ABC transporter substrate-binding protein PstS family protein [Natrinema sp. 1APR25-10V2]
MTDTKTDRSVRSFSRRKVLAATGAVGALSLAGCTENTGNGAGSGNGDRERVVVTGSSTVFPVSDTLAEQFMEQNDDVSVTTDSTGTGGGFSNNFCPGNSDINGASRPIQDAELQNCRDNGVEPIEFQIGKDAVTMAVNNDSPVDCLSYDQLAQIWSQNGAQTWSDVNSEWPDAQIQRYGPPSTSGTFDWFRNNVIGDAGSHVQQYEKTENDNELITGISSTENAIGYFGYAYYQQNEDKLKALEISQSEGGECVAPSIDAAQSGDYPMARPLYIYASEEALQRDPVYNFVEFYIEQSSTNTISDVGYVPVSEEQAQSNLEKLENAVN